LNSKVRLSALSAIVTTCTYIDRWTCPIAQQCEMVDGYNHVKSSVQTMNHEIVHASPDFDLNA